MDSDDSDEDNVNYDKIYAPSVVDSGLYIETYSESSENEDNRVASSKSDDHCSKKKVNVNKNQLHKLFL